MAAGAALPATAGDTDTATDGVCGIGDAMLLLFYYYFETLCFVYCTMKRSNDMILQPHFYINLRSNQRRN